MFLVKKLAGAAALALSLTGAASAAPVVLDFEGVGNVASVNDFYNGGTDAQGNSGTNYGINFSTQSLALVDLDAGGGGNFANEPTPSTVLFFLTGGAATMNVAAGFDTGFSFYYTASEAGFVHVYEGLNATGNLLASLKLGVNIGNCAGDPQGSYCRFDPIGITFNGIARSVDFGGVADEIGFDNITLGSVVPGNPAPVPEPGAIAMWSLGLGLAGVAAARRRRPAA